MANLAALLSLASDLDRLAVTPFYEASPYTYHRAPAYMAVMPGDLPLPQSHHHHPHAMARREHDGPVSTIGKHGFQVSMDVQQFKPSELSVKVVDDHVVVEGRHEEREDNHGYISRHFVRRYRLPKSYDHSKVVSTLSSDGVLTVSVPKPQVEDKSNERIVNIQQVGPAHLNVKENPKEAVEGGEKKKEATDAK